MQLWHMPDISMVTCFGEKFFSLEVFETTLSILDEHTSSMLLHFLQIKK